jgi:hypothetical protein
MSEYTLIGIRKYEHKLIVEALKLLVKKRTKKPVSNDVQILNDLLGDIADPQNLKWS